MPRLPKVPALLASIAAQLVLLAVAIHFTPNARIETSFDGASVEIAADRSWTILPGQCATVTWDLEGIQSLYINGEGKVGHDQMEFCPRPSAMEVHFDITAGSGVTREFTLIIQGLPAAIEAWLTFLALISPLLIAVYYLATMRLTETAVVDLSPLLLLIVLLLLGLLIQIAQPSIISSVLDTLGDVFKRPSWHLFGSLLAGLIFVPLVLQVIRQGRLRGMRADLAAVGAFFVLVFLLLAPVGFDSIVQWESWASQAYLEGLPSKIETELILRFWVLAPHALASTISPHSFAGYHWLNLFMFWGMLVFFYAILRQLHVPAWLAFLVALLFLVYPVNDRLMSLRSIPHTFSKLSVLAAICLVLDCRENASRLHLLGIWLALLFNVGSSETALVMILSIPILWWWKEPRRIWRNVNLTVIWYLVPIAKVAHVLLMLLFGRFFYGSWFIQGTNASDFITWDKAVNYLDATASVYRRTFLDGWQEALNAISQNAWIAPTVASLALIGLISVYLSRETIHDPYPPRKRILGAVLAGLLFIVPSIGGLLWLDEHNRDLWRMYVYVPTGAAIAILGLVALVAASINRVRVRQAVIVGLSLLLIFPSLSRLYVQKSHFEDSANAKAKILMQIVEQAPYFDSSANLILVTSMTADVFVERVKGLSSNMLFSAFFILYPEGRPMDASVCRFGYKCRSSNVYVQRDLLANDNDFSDVVMFRLHDDLRVELLRELPPELGDRVNVNYHPERLIDTSAPIPSRALTMLVSARRD